MKKHILYFVAIILFCTSCFTNVPLVVKQSDNNKTYNVHYLFEQDGYKVYRFYDQGNFVYFTTKGNVTSYPNDSTKIQVIHPN